MIRVVACAAVLAGCASVGSRITPDTSRGIADAHSIYCAQAEAQSLGYVVLRGERDAFRAEKTLPDEGSGLRMRGIIFVRLREDAGVEKLFAHGERHAEEGRRAPGGLPPERLPQPPTPGPNPYDTTRRDRPRPEARRLDPGPVRFDADQIVRRCTVASG